MRQLTDYDISLSDEQWKLVIEGRKLGFHMLKLMNFPPSEREEINHDVCLLVLIRAARLFRPERGVKFSTYACNALRNELIKVRGRLSPYLDRTRLYLLPFGSLRNDDPSGLSALLSSLEATYDGSEEDVAVKEEAEFFRSQLTEEDQALVDMRFVEDLTFREIGKRRGCTRQNIQTRMCKILKQLRSIERTE